MTRPDALPDFKNPPLSEVVLGIQFAPAKRYQQIRAGEVWSLYRSDFPHVEELRPLAPTFETFGLPAPSAINLGLVTGAMHDRFWFLSAGKEELIQFQHDRLLHNWRKMGDEKNEYPRFEKMIARFQNEIGRLERYFDSLEAQTLIVNQCEVSYINQLPFDQNDKVSRSAEWVRFLDFDTVEPDDFSAIFRRAIRDQEGKPYARLICEAAIAVSQEGRRVMMLTLTARGAPPAPNVDAALGFLRLGHDVIVRTFAEITTDSAHARWERIR